MLETPMLDTLPMRLLAQLDGVSVFQTAAIYNTAATDEVADKPLLIKNQHSYGELNLGLHVKDNPATVLNNRMRVLAAINQHLTSKITSLHWVNQVHGKQIYDVDATALSMRPVDADAMLSNQANTGLAMMTADCVPIVLYQPNTGQIAAIHAGWQGLACGVIKATLERFVDDGQVLAWIGVCISHAHYEVGLTVYEQLLTGCSVNQLLPQSSIDNFESLFCAAVDINEPSNPYSSNQSIDNQNLENKNIDNTSCSQNSVAKLAKNATVKTDKLKINLSKLAAAELAFFGVQCCNESPITCSYADSHYYSYRRQTHLQQPATGRMALIIVRHAL